MKKFIIFIAALFFLLASFVSSDVASKTAFIATAQTITASTTITNGTEFTSVNIPIGATTIPIVGVTVLFTRTTGGAATLDANFEVSYDNGTTWASFDDAQLQIATNHTVVTGSIVRFYQPLPVYGVSHIRLKSLVNNWSGGSLTLVNVYLTTSRR